MKETPKERAERAAKAVTAIGYNDDLDLDSAISDLLTDLRHLSEQHDLNFEHLLGVARRNYIGKENPSVGYNPKEGFDEIEIFDSDEFAYDSADGVYEYSEGQAKPLAEQSLDDFEEYFRRCDGLTFVFLALGNPDSSDQVNTVYPDTISAISLAARALREVGDAPSDNATGSEHFADDTSHEIVSAIQDRIAEMDRRGVEYSLIWQLATDEVAHAACSGSRMDWDQLSDFLAEELMDVFRL